MKYGNRLGPEFVRGTCRNELRSTFFTTILDILIKPNRGLNKENCHFPEDPSTTNKLAKVVVT